MRSAQSFKCVADATKSPRRKVTSLFPFDTPLAAGERTAMAPVVKGARITTKNSVVQRMSKTTRDSAAPPLNECSFSKDGHQGHLEARSQCPPPPPTLMSLISHVHLHGAQATRRLGHLDLRHRGAIAGGPFPHHILNLSTGRFDPMGIIVPRHRMLR